MSIVKVLYCLAVQKIVIVMAIAVESQIWHWAVLLGLFELQNYFLICSYKCIETCLAFVVCARARDVERPLSSKTAAL
jgi:hypothetical protein